MHAELAVLTVSAVLCVLAVSVLAVLAVLTLLAELAVYTSFIIRLSAASLTTKRRYECISYSSAGFVVLLFTMFLIHLKL